MDNHDEVHALHQLALLDLFVMKVNCNGDDMRLWRNERWTKAPQPVSRIGVVSLEQADGNCMFRALCDQLYGSTGQHLHLRQQVVQYMQQNRENFEPFLEDDEAFDSYIKRMSDDGCWGGNLELVRTTLPPFLRHTVCSSIIACANFLPIISECMTAGMWIAQQAASLLKQMNICVHLPRNNASCFLLRNFPEDQSFLHLAYEGDGCAEHYDSVRLPRSDPAAAGGPFELPEIQTSCAQKHGKSIDSKDDEASKLEHVRKVASNATKAVALEALRAADNDIDAAVELATSWSAAGIDDMQCSTAAHDGSNEGNSCSSDGEDRNDVSWAPKQQSIDAQKQQRGRGKTKAARKEAKKDRKRRERMEAAAARTHKSGKGSESSCSHSAQAADTAHRENIVDGATLEI